MCAYLLKNKKNLPRVSRKVHTQKERTVTSLISQKLSFPQELAPCTLVMPTCRLPGIIGLVPPPTLDELISVIQLRFITIGFKYFSF